MAINTVARLLKKRKKNFLITLDWINVKGFQMLLAGAVLKGRPIPIAWTTTTNHMYNGHPSHNPFEKSLLLVRCNMIPPTIKIVILTADGFGGGW